MKTGISVYFGSGRATCERVIERAAAAGVSYAFTSLQIPEETGVDYGREARHLLGLLRDAEISLIVDVGPDTPAKLGCDSIEGLAGLGISHVRLDYGFTVEETVALSRTFHIVFNASTVTRDEIAAWRAAGADLTRFAACHNYYPKRFTGLALNDIRRMNDFLRSQGFQVLGFIPGDGEQRGPLFEGLPTVEEQRNRRSDVARSLLELGVLGACDVVLVGDVDLSEAGWEQLAAVSAGYVDVRCELEPDYEYLRGQVHHDRPDSSALVLRTPESRTSLRPAGGVPVDASAGAARPAGTIAVSNARYLRYEGELEISRVDLPGDERMNIAGHVAAEDLRLLPLVRDGFGLRFA